MKRLLFLLVAVSTPLLADEALLTAPHLTNPTPEAAAGDALHEKYEAAWIRYEKAIGEVREKVNAALDAQFEKAADAGNLDLADMWDKKKKVFADTDSVAWPSDGKTKAEWRKKHPTTEFPDDFSEVIASAGAGFEKAVATLTEDYESLVKEYTKQRNLARAKALRDELAGLAGKPVERLTMKEMKPEAKKPKPRRMISLTTCVPSTKEALHNWFAINTLPGNWETPCRIVVNGQLCKSFIFAHAPSKVVFDLPPDAKRFTATGVCPAGIPPDRNPDFVGDWIYAVIIDGQQFFRERLGDRELAISVDIPTGARTITLVGDPNGRVNWDCLVWANPVLEVE
jgi:hypothetical protein